MPTITKRVIKGHTYYYAVKSARVNGKPRLVWQKYLGTAEDLIRLHDAPQTPVSVRVLRFGAEAALLHVATQLGVMPIIDQILPKRTQGQTVGMYLLLAAINRGCAPRSKRSLADWFFGSMLTYRFPAVSAADLTSQRFWDHMERVDVALIPQIEEALAKRVIEIYGIDLHTLIYDTTNFFTFIDTFNRRCTIARRGKNKQKRCDLRQVNLALMVTQEYHLPLFHRCYEGNRVDAESFRSIVDDLVMRMKQVAHGCTEVTVVFDKGNNSEDALQTLDSSPYHFIGALIPSAFPDLLQVEKTSYRDLVGERFAGMRAYRDQRDIFGVQRTVVVVFSPIFFTKQLQTVLAVLEKAKGKLQALQHRLTLWETGVYKKGRAPTVTSVKKQVKEILRGQYLPALLTVTLTRAGTIPQLAFQLQNERLETLTQTVFGKTLLFTDNHTWTTEEIVSAFFAKGEVEEAFRRMKDRAYASWFPLFHWTDQKITVHALYCVLALLLTSLLYREANRAGIDISQRKVMEKLTGIYHVLHLYPPSSRGGKAPRPQMMVSEQDPIQQQLWRLFNLEHYQ